MKKKRVGITGQTGFIGSHLYNFLSLKQDIELISFDRDFFDDKLLLERFVKNCDIVVHLAAMNRHKDPKEIYTNNVSLVEKLINACEATSTTPWILFSSSTQETEDNMYGQSKKQGRKLLEEWSERSGGVTTGLIIPNVFGPFGKPFYNSVVATFCQQLVSGEKPEIIKDNRISLIYINELIEIIYDTIPNKTKNFLKIPHRYELTVSELLNKLNQFYEEYFINDLFPNLTSSIDLDLFNTFRCYIPHSHYPKKLIKHSDERGAFVEIVRANTSGQFSFSNTVPGITRGNHFHTRKAERFVVIKGEALIELRKINTKEVISYKVDGNTPAYIDMPIWYTHNIKNIGNEDLLTLFWINEPYDKDNPDTYFETV